MRKGEGEEEEGARNNPNKLEMSNGTPADPAPLLNQNLNKESEMSQGADARF